MKVVEINIRITPPPVGVTFERGVPVPMRDGTILRANVFRPKHGGRHPVLLSAQPCGKDALPARTRSGRGKPLQYRLAANDEPMSFSAWTSLEAPDPAYWVGMTGVSYLAISQWTAAATRPPSLAAISPWEGFTDAYRDFSYPGGIREDGFMRTWSLTQKLLRPRSPGFRRAQTHHPHRDDWWVARSPDLERINVPALVCACFSDHSLHSRGSFEGCRRIVSPQKWL